jgi:hypothetical protein
MNLYSYSDVPDLMNLRREKYNIFYYRCADACDGAGSPSAKQVEASLS